MKKIIGIFLFLINLTNFTYGQEKEQFIRRAFNNYKSAILTGKGEEAIKFVDSRTTKYYVNILGIVKTADSLKITSLPLIDKMTVLFTRHTATKEEILSMNGNDLFIYSVKKGMVGESSIDNIEIGDVVVDGNFAIGQLVSNGQKTSIHFLFYKEDGQWKFDLTSMFSITNMAIKKMIQDSGENENDFWLSVLEMLTGSKPKKEIWQPIL